MDTQNRLEMLKTSLKRCEQATTVAETQQKAALEQRAEIEAKIYEYNIDPRQLRSEIDVFEQEIDDNLAQVEALIPEL